MGKMGKKGKELNAGKGVGKAKKTSNESGTGRRDGGGSVPNLEKQADRAAARRKAVARLAFWCDSGLPGKCYMYVHPFISFHNQPLPTS